MPNVTANKIIFDQDDFLAGLHPNFSAAPSDSPIPRGSGQLTFASSMNPFRNFGYASPGFNPTDVTNVSTVTNSAIRQITLGAETSTSYAYGVNSNTKMFRFDPTTAALDASALRTVLTVSGAVELNSLVFYSAKKNGATTRAPRIFYAFNATGATSGDPLWNVGRYDLDGTNFDDDFMGATGANGGPATPLSSIDSSTTSSASSLMPHPMIVGDDDVLYIADGRYLHGYDGASTETNASGNQYGKFIAQVLTLPANFRITGLARYQRRLAIFGYTERLSTATANPSSFFATQSTCYFWDYLNDDPYDAVDLNDNFVSGIFEYKSTIGCFTQGRKPVPGSNQFSRLQIYNGSEFVAVAMFDKNIPLNGGVEVIGDTVMWNSQGQIMQWGSPYPGFPDGLNKVTAGSGTDSGALKTLSTTMQVASTGTSTSGGLQKLTTSYTTGSFATAVANPSFPAGKVGKVHSVKIEFAKTSSDGRSIDIILFGNGLSATTVLSTLSTVDSGSIVKEYYETSGDNELPKFYDLSLIGQWQSGSGATDAPILKRVEVTFETINDEST